MIVIASRNSYKIAEITELAASHGLKAKPIADYEGCPEVEEEGITFEENAAIKAVKYSLWLKRVHGVWPPVIAEDAGLEIEALMGWPGVYSARVAPTNEERIKLVLEKLEGAITRSAKFVACTSMAINGHLVHQWTGTASGSITEEPVGGGGFGYDPLFFDPVLGCTYAQVTSQQKSGRSHRAKAWNRTLAYIAKHQHMLE